MKVIFSHSLPFSLAHGGVQVLIESLMQSLAGLGVEVEPERWWDEKQHGDILHFVGRPNGNHVRFARDKGYKVVLTDLLDETGSRTKRELAVQRATIRFSQRMFPQLTGRLGWDAYRSVDALVFIVPHERDIARYLFDAAPGIVRIIPHGLPVQALEALAKPQREEDYLISVATIDSRKNTLLLAKAARRAQVPVLFLGRPFSEQDAYYREFISCVDNEFVRYAGYLPEPEKIARIRGARGFVLLSRFESGCFAVYEAARAGLPMLLPDLPWAQHYPAGDGIRFVRRLTMGDAAEALAAFYATAHRRPAPIFDVNSWDKIAGQYLDLYRQILQP